jgi:CheY-like chemotaxis protein
MRHYAFLIDDDPMQLKLGEFLIKKHNIFEQATCYLKASTALKYLTINCLNELALPEVILLDLDMPELSGWDFLKLFNNLQPYMVKKIDIFVISSSADQKANKLLKSYPFVKGSYMKPISLDILLSIVLEKTPQQKDIRALKKH